MSGKHRLGCATRRDKSTCDSALTIARSAVGRRVLDGLRERMLTPEFVCVFEAETVRLQREVGRRSAEAWTRQTEVERKIAGIVASIENAA